MPNRRALIVIDVQNEYVTGDLPIEFPDVRLSLRNIGRAMDAARAHAVPVVVVQNTAPQGSPIFAKNSSGWKLHPSVEERPYDHYIEKTLPSAFAGTDLEAWLQAHNIDTLSVIGYMTHNCVDSTIKHALHTGRAVESLHDATGSVSYENSAGRVDARTLHETVDVVLQSRFAAVLSTDAWIHCLESGSLPQRDTIYASNQRARMRL